MPRYVKRTRSFDDDWYGTPLLTSIDAWESAPVDTGLLDHEGNTIWRVNDPIGFTFD